jgi:hypothetical protein
MDSGLEARLGTARKVWDDLLARQGGPGRIVYVPGALVEMPPEELRAVESSRGSRAESREPESPEP